MNRLRCGLAVGALCVLGLLVGSPSDASADDEAKPVEVEQRVLDWLKNLFTGKTDEAFADTAVPFAAGARHPKDGDRLEVKVFTEDAVVRKLLAGAKAPHKVKAFTRVDESHPVTAEQAAKVPEVARVLPKGGQRLVVGDATDLNPDLLEIWVTPDGKVAAVIEIEH